MNTPTRPLRPLCNALLATLVCLLAACGGAAVPTDGGGGILPGTWKPTEVIGSGSAANAVAIDGDGNAAAVWTRLSEVWANAYNAAGGGWGPAHRIDGHSGQVGSATVAMGGGAMAVWQEGTIATRRFAAGQWGGVDSVPGSAGNAITPLAGMDDSGNAFVAWWRASDYRLFISRRAAGAWEQTPTEVTADSAANSPSLAVSANGDALIAWTSGGGHVDTRRYTPATGWDAPDPADRADDNAGTPTGAQAALDELGNAFVVWNEGGVLKGNHRQAGGAWAGETTVYADGGLGSYLLAAGHGAAMAAWNENGRVGAAAFDPGTGWAPTLPVENNTNLIDDLRLGMDHAGNAIALWTVGDRVMVNRHTAAAGWGQAKPLDGNAGLILGPRLAVSSGGTAMAVWKQGGGADQIAAARYAP